MMAMTNAAINWSQHAIHVVTHWSWYTLRYIDHNTLVMIHVTMHSPWCLYTLITLHVTKHVLNWPQ